MKMASADPGEPFTPAGYLLAYFTGDDASDAERVRVAVSANPSLRDWIPLPPPELPDWAESRGCRDPFVLFDSRAERLVLLATDARAWPGHDWDELVTEGRRTIWIWSAPIAQPWAWSPARSVEIAPPGAGNAWAPKAHWNAAASTWSVTFSSAIYPLGPRTPSESYQRIFETTTPDFVHFSPAVSVLDAGFDIIDLLMVDTPGGAVRLTVPHPDRELPSGIRIERASSPGAPASELLSRRAGAQLLGATEGPAMAARADPPGWYLIVDEFGGRGCVTLEADSVADEWRIAASARLPPHARHGSLLALDRSLHERLRQASAQRRTDHTDRQEAERGDRPAMV